MEKTHDVQIGDIFVMHLKNGDNDVCHFAQITRLKGRTMVEFAFIKKEFFEDETCERARGQCRVRPLPNEFYENKTIQVARVRDGGACIRTVSHAKPLRFTYRRYDPKDAFYLWEDSGRHGLKIGSC